MRKDGAEKFGEWYHFFGILAFSVRELAVNGSVDAVESAVRWNRRLNPILAGDFEEPEKARLDEDSVKVSEELVALVQSGASLEPFRSPQGRAYCATPEAYRLLSAGAFLSLP